MSVTIQFKRGTAISWTTNNPVLAQGEIGVETDTGKGKVGDGVTAWTSLAYGLGSGTIHIDSSNEFTEVSEKAVTVSADKFLIEDSENGGAKKYVVASNLPAGIDTTAFHKATPSEISALTQKASPVGADYLLIEDSADSNNKKYVLISDLPTGSDSFAIHSNTANEINNITEKNPPVTSDVLLIEDSANGYNKKRVSLANMPGGVDITAIHKSTDAEISALPGVVVADGDVMLVEDANGSFSKGKTTVSELATYTIGKIGLFSIVKNGDQQTTSTTYTDVINWNSPAINTADITVNLGLGSFTFVNAGTYEVQYNLTDIQTSGSNRNFAEHRLVLDGALIPGTYGKTYNRNTTDDGTHVACTRILTVTAGQVLKLQFRTDNSSYGQSVIADSCAINIKRWA